MKDATPAEIFAALKLIEQLYQDGHIQQYMFKNILNEHRNIVDITEFNLQRKVKMPPARVASLILFPAPNHQTNRCQRTL